MMHRGGRSRQRRRSRRQQQNPETELVLCVGGPPPLRRRLELAATSRFLVILDLARAMKFLAENRVARVLVDPAVFTGRSRPVPAYALSSSAKEVPDVPD